mgnify:CR=1|jgi:hypothetical protein
MGSSFIAVVIKCRNIAEDARDLWMKHEALKHYACKEEELKLQKKGEMKSRSFIEMAKSGSDEKAGSRVMYLSRGQTATRLKKVMEEG